MRTSRKLAALGLVGLGVVIGAVCALSVPQPVIQAQSPTAALEEREVYYPGTEDLAPDEMRVIACGTGMPNARPKQAAACWLVVRTARSVVHGKRSRQRSVRGDR